MLDDFDAYSLIYGLDFNSGLYYWMNAGSKKFNEIMSKVGTTHLFKKYLKVDLVCLWVIYINRNKGIN